MANRDQAVKRTNVIHYPPSVLKVRPGLNVRDLTSEAYQAKIAELVEDIASNGVRTPIETFSDGGEVYVSHGHTRHAALLVLLEQGRAPDSVPTIPEPRGRDDADRIVDQYRLNIGSPLSHVEIAYNISRLVKLGWTTAKIAQRHSKSESWVDQMLTFGEATPETKAAVAAGKISASLVTDIVRKEGPTKAAKTVQKAVAAAESAGKAKATPQHIIHSGEAESDVTTKQLRKLLTVLRTYAGRGGAGAGNWAAKFLIEAGIEL